MVQEYFAYIDEAGDEGLGKLRQPDASGQSRWLAVGAAIVSRQNSRHMPKWRDEVMERFKKKKRPDLHFKELNHRQRVVACNALADKEVGICVVASNKITLLDSPKFDVFKQKGHLYNYLVRYLLERVTDVCLMAAKAAGDTEARLHVTFSRRANTDYQSMHDYLCLMRDGREVIKPVRSINWNVLDPNDVRVENHSKVAGLQIADTLTSATYCALDPNEYGYCEPRYALSLKQRYITHKGRILGCGLTLVPPYHKNPLNEEQKVFIQALNRKRQAPGS